MVASRLDGTKRPGCPGCPACLALREVVLEPLRSHFYATHKTHRTYPSKCLCGRGWVFGGWGGGGGRVLTVAYPAYAVVPPGFAPVAWVEMAEDWPP